MPEDEVQATEQNEQPREPEETEAEPKAKSPRSATIAVAVVKAVGKAAIVQWQGGDEEQHRSTVPAESIDEGKVKESVLKAGEPNFRWEDEGFDQIWARALRRAGLFTIEDYLANSMDGLNALRGAANLIMREIIQRRRSQRS